MTADLRDVTGFRGELIVEDLLTDYQAFAKPLFRPGFLGDKWPSIDFYVELRNLRGRTPYFFVQAKSTGSTFPTNSRSLRISMKKRDVERLLRIPGPTYVFGVHEPSRRVFVRSVHLGTPVKGIARIPLSNELTTGNLQVLYDEVRMFWKTTNHKPQASVFA
jgi:Domain of unknown function (DUF4365)